MLQTERGRNPGAGACTPGTGCELQAPLTQPPRVGDPTGRRAERTRVAFNRIGGAAEAQLTWVAQHETQQHGQDL